jgi:spoIIIJ-associated protein
MEQHNLDIIKKTVKEFFDKTGFPVELNFSFSQDKTVFIGVRTDESKILIGQNGQVLAEMQKLVKALLKRNIQEEFYIDIDINDYKKRKNEYLREAARDLADEVSLIKRERTLPCMPSYERRIVHMELANRSDVVVESVGEEPERRIIIKPVLS